MRDEGADSLRQRLRRQLWQPPRAHGEQPQERVVGPLELFYDLVVVVLVAQAAHHLAGRLTWSGVGAYSAVFGLVWIAWVNGSLHHELHGHEDARGRSAFLLQILVLVPLGAFIPAADGVRGPAFAVAAGVLFLVLAMLWLSASRGDRPEYRRSSRVFVVGTLLCATVNAWSLAANRARPRPRPGTDPQHGGAPSSSRRPGAAACGREGCHRSKVTVTGAWSDQRSAWVAARSTTAVTALAARPGVAMW